jgi:hypothetical protein
VDNEAVKAGRAPRNNMVGSYAAVALRGLLSNAMPWRSTIASSSPSREKSAAR